MKLRVATAEDLIALLPRRIPRRLFQAYMTQLRRSAAFAALDADGVFAVGGLFDAGEEREAWLHLRASPRVRVRDLLVACACVLENAGEGPPLTASVAAGDPRALRFAEFLGFVNPREISAHSLAPRGFKLTRCV